jgi:hypothetical protein
VEDEEEYSKFMYNNVSFFVDTTRLNIVETNISYNNVIPYGSIDGDGKLVHV